MSNHKKAVEKIIKVANEYGLDVMSLVLEDGDHAFVAATSVNNLIRTAELVQISLDNTPDELLEEECDCPNCSPVKDETKFFELMQNSFPGLFETMPEDVKEQMTKEFASKSEEDQIKLFEKTFNILQVMHTLFNILDK